MPKNCPVCGAPIEHYTDYLDGHTLMEEYFTCQGSDKEHCGYAWGYTYGQVEAAVGPFEFVYYAPTSSNETTVLIDEQFRAACMAQRVVIMLLQSQNKEATLDNLG